MSHFGDFMDDVPVKISEKYKRQARIDLPYSVNESISRAQKVVECTNASNYSCQFERNVLVKLKELRNAKETKKNERRHRLQLLQEVEQKRLDAIAAAEEEDRLKQLSVSEVSYPSTDEISTLHSEDKLVKNCDNPCNLDNIPENVDVSANIQIPLSNVPTDTELNILQPIQVKANYPESSLLDDPDPLQNLKLNNKITKISHNSNIDTLTFRDFENDTSSPFDNVELKTINDMELLAQVLQSQKESATSCHQQPQPPYIVDQTYAIPNCASQAHLDGTTYVPNTYLEQPILGSSMMYNSPQHFPISNGYYMPTDTENIYMPNYQYYVPSTPYPPVEPYYGGQLPASSDISQASNGSPYIPQPYYYQYSHVPVQYPQETANAPNYIPPVPNENTDHNIVTVSQNTVKSRSRSVPDIVRELNEELEKLRINERSYNTSPAPKNTPQPVPETSTAKDRISKRKSENLPNPFDKLPPKSQEMCRKIHGMGFPLDRVARVCTLVGDNDKKVIECLLIVGDLMDLGFNEDKVSAALVKHEFNRDQALDELVS